MGNFELKNVFPVFPGKTLELATSQFWSMLGETTLTSEIQFLGLSIHEGNHFVTHDGTHKYNRLFVTSLSKYNIKPTIALTTVRVPTKPSSSSIKQLSEPRDRLWTPSRSSELLLTYDFSVKESCKVTFNLPGLSELLYESPIEGQLWMIFTKDTNELKGVGEALGRYKFELAEGNYFTKIVLRSSDSEWLEKNKQLTCVVEYILPKETNLDIYSDRSSASLASGSKFSSKIIHSQRTVPLFVSTPSESSLPKQAVAGSTIEGTLYWNKEVEGFYFCTET